MRKKQWLAGMLAAGMLLAAPAWAAEGVPGAAKNENGSYTVTWSGAAGERYTLMALKAGADPAALRSGDILYTAMAAADEDGQVTFSNVRLRVARSADLYVSGGGARSEKGTITIDGIPVTASVTAEGRTYATGVQAALLQGGTVVQTITAPPSGLCEFDAVEAGEYTIQCTLDGYLTTKTAVVVTEGETAAAVALRAGDVNGDGQVTPADLFLVIGNLGNLGSYVNPAAADQDGDGQVTEKDVALVAGHFMEKGD